MILLCCILQTSWQVTVILHYIMLSNVTKQMIEKITSMQQNDHPHPVFSTFCLVERTTPDTDIQQSLGVIVVYLLQ